MSPAVSITELPLHEWLC